MRAGIVRSFVWVWVVFQSAGALAGPTRYVFTPDDLRGAHKASCMQRIEEVVTSVLAPGRSQMCIGHYGNLESLLDRAQVPAGDAAGIVGWLDSQKSKPQSHPIFAHTVDEMKRVGSSASLFVCVLKKECSFAPNLFVGDAVALHLATEPLRLERFPDLKPAKVSVQDRRAPSSLDQRGMAAGLHIVVMKAPDTHLKHDGEAAALRADFVSALAHETTHSADQDLFSDWILANYTLIRQKRYDEVDTLFLQITRDGSHGLLRVDEGFLATFMESRGYAVSEWVDSQHPGARPKGLARRVVPETVGASGFFTQPMYQVQLGNAETAIQVIRERGGGWFLDLNKIDETNVFDFGIRLGKRFEKVIQAAGIRRP